jgi:hypothetical protein
VRSATSIRPPDGAPAGNAGAGLFDLRYSALALLQVALGAANLLLLYRAYGSGDASATFLLALSIVSSLQLVFLMASEQFVFHFHRARAVGPARAESLYAASLAALGAAGAIAGVAAHVASPWLVDVLASGLGEADAAATASLLSILSLSLAVFLPFQLVQSYLGATERFAASYWVAIAPAAAQTLVLASGFAHPVPVETVAWAYVAGHAAGLTLGLAWAPPRPERVAAWPWAAVRAMAIDSARIKAAHNIHNVLLLAIVNQFASHLPSALAAMLFYAKRAADTCLSIVYGPTHKILLNRITVALSRGAADEIPAWTRRTDRLLPPAFAAAIALGVAVAPALGWLNPVDADAIAYLRWTFALLMLQALLIATELPFAIVNLAQGRIGVFYLSNTLFVAALAGLVAALGGAARPHALALSIVAAQTINFVLIRRHAIASLRAPATAGAAP